MSILHTFNQSPFSSQTLKNTLPLIRETDKILLTQDAVLSFHHPLLSQLNALKAPVYCLKDDLLARGIRQDHESNISAISYQDFVNLSIECEKVISW